MDPDVVDVPVAATEGIGVYSPETQWEQILALGVNPDPRTGNIFWRLSSDADDTIVKKSFRLAPAEKPTLVFPRDGEEAREDNQLPNVQWNANHADHFEVRFSSNPSLSPPTFTDPPTVIKPGYDCVDVTPETPDEVTTPIPPEVWNGIVALSKLNSDHKVYFAVFAKDRLGRVTWSAVRHIKIVD